MKFSKEFKEAISGLSSAEKDKLILRLLKKDLNLANRLAFELLSEQSVDQRRVEMEVAVKKQVVQMKERFYSPGYLHMDLRFLSGDINNHVTITKDKFGEVYLNLVMLTEVLEKLGDTLATFTAAKNRKVSVYIIARSFKILTLINKMHPDLWIEFEDLTHKLGVLIGKQEFLMNTALHHGLDVNWLINYQIPEDIAAMQKELRARGYLK